MSSSLLCVGFKSIGSSYSFLCPQLLAQDIKKKEKIQKEAEEKQGKQEAENNVVDINPNIAGTPVNELKSPVKR